MADTRFDFGLKGIGAELTARKMAVPIYQRDYAWGDADDRDEVTDFWSDLQETLVQQEGHEYFLGTIVLSKESRDHPDRQMVIDGQQRLATTTILMAVIRDVYREHGDEARANHVQATYLSRYDLRSGEQIPQLFMNADDDPYFRKRIIDGDAEATTAQRSHELILQCYTMLLEKVRTGAGAQGPAWADYLGSWVDFLEERVRIIAVAVPTESDAFLIFETLNDRGADLTIADLLKNYLFGHAGQQLDSVRNAWVSTMTSLELSASGGKLFTDFLRHYWSSKYGATRERELYGRIKDRVSTQAQTVELAQELDRGARLYAAVLNSDHEVWGGLGTITKDHVEALQVLNLEQIRPLMLALMQHFGEAELKRAMRAMVSWGLRGLVAGSIGGGHTERAYCEAAMAVRSGDVKDVDKLLEKLSAIIPSDEVFASEFETARVSRGRLARYMLIALERQRQGDHEPELVPNEREEEVNLEHVLPKNPSSEDWPNFDSETHKAMLHRLGNLALLQKGPNDKLGNKPFAEKKPVLEASKLLWTQNAGNRSEWTTEIIRARQKEMAADAAATWPLRI